MIKQTLAAEVIAGDIQELRRSKNESNKAWLARAYSDFPSRDPLQWSFIVLAGGKDVAAFRLRVAQSHLRRDMLPSFWSDCMLLQVDPADFAASLMFGLPLLQPASALYAPYRNGLVKTPLKDLSSAKVWPNLALLALPVPQQKVLNSLNSIEESRISYDAVENILPWLAFIWGAGNAGNPLLHQTGFPAAMMLNQIYAAHGYDLAPGVGANLSAPETFWSGVKNWQQYYAKAHGGQVPGVRYVTDHLYDIDEGL